ncbi:MAG TPA: hypothetical protein VFU49_19975 [Ktedonobacteraceae bacterium]|nr:hypothetical protein [Ktedonobacteraceae bacterium]
MGRKVSLSFFLSSTLLAIILGIGLVACGSNQGGGAATGTTPTATTGSTSPTATTTAQTGVQQCGSINIAPRGTVENAGLSTKAADCFWKAYQQCQAASLIYRVGGLDTSTVRTLTIEKQNGACAITDAVQNFVVPHQIGPTKNYVCNKVSNSNGQLHISGCGADGTVIIPVASI